MDKKHTKGPWKPDKQGVILGGPDYCTSVATTAKHFYESGRSMLGVDWYESEHVQKMLHEHDANAQLIAAAPEMLAALDNLLAHTLDLRMKEGFCLTESETKLRAIALDAIAKATGTN